MRTTWQVLGTEIRRGPALVAALFTAVAGVLILQGESFGARWMSLASAVQYSLFLVAPVMMAVAVWHGGRERRRKLGELLESTPRPPIAPVAANWAGLTIGTFAGLLVVVGLGAVQVAPQASYWGGGWWWLLAGVFVGIAAVTAVGMLMGYLLPYRALAPLAGIGMYALMVILLDGPLMQTPVTVSGVTQLVQQEMSALIPLRRTNDLDGRAFPTSDGMMMVAWIGAIAVAALIARASTRTVMRIGVWAIPVVAWIGMSPTGVVEDAVALEPVCEGSEREVCLARMNAYSMEDARQVADDVFNRWEGIPGAPTGGRDARLPGPDDELALSLQEEEWTAHYGVTPECAVSDAAWKVTSIVNEWGSTESRAVRSDRVSELRSWPEAEQRDWITRYVAAADDCDEEELIALAGELA